MQHGRLEGVRKAGLILATTALLPSFARAQQPACDAAIARATLATQVVASAVATGVEYGDMERQPTWRFSPDRDKAAIIADPSSHLHFLGSYHLARSSVRHRCDDDASRARAAWKGAAVSLSVGMAKEVADGYYNGFSVTDLAVDAAGAGFAVAQAYVPLLDKITPSFSVAPRTIFRRRGPRGAMTNYADQTVWLSANVHDMLPKQAAKVWPSPIRLSVGRRAFGGSVPSEYTIGLDLDAARLPGNHPVWVQAKRFLHGLRLPGPALVMSPTGTTMVGLYW